MGSWLAIYRLKNSLEETVHLVSPVVASFALTISIVIMVTSFKTSVVSWLDKLLIADVYGSIKQDQGYTNIDKKLREKISNIDGIKKIEFSKSFPLSLDASKVDIDLVVRKLEHKQRDSKLPLIGKRLTIKKINSYYENSENKIVVYLSESMRNVYKLKLNNQLQLPLPGGLYADTIVGGFYRDYSRQHGSIVILEKDFEKTAGRPAMSSMALWLKEGSEANKVTDSIKNLDESLKSIEFTNSKKIRDISIKIFDQTFLVAYLLGFIALFISIFSVVCNLISQMKVRHEEFSIQNQLGVKKYELMLQTGFENSLICFQGVLWGTIAGIGISLVLVYFINPQSFNWTMDYHIPFNYIFFMGFTIILASFFYFFFSLKVFIFRL